jgi:hypothetical protein
MTSKNARKRQRQRRQKARAKAKKQATRQSVTASASRPAPPRAVVPVVPAHRPQAAARATAVSPPVKPPVAPPPPIRVDPPARSRGRQRITLGVAAALVSVVALVGAALLVMHPGSGDGRAERSAAATRYSPPRPVQPNTSYVKTRVLSSGDLRVTHWIDSQAPVSAIHLTQPDVGGLPSLEVSKVVVAGDQTRAIRSSSNKRDYYFSAAHHLFIRYTLSGAITRAPRPAGRGLAVITNLEVGGVSGLTETTHSVVGVRVLNLACSAATPEGLPSPCGSSGTNGWQATLDGASVDDRVMAQLDLGGAQQ